MKELFMYLLRELAIRGKITAANLYRDGTISTIEVENEDAIYEVVITKKEKKDNA